MTKKKKTVRYPEGISALILHEQLAQNPAFQTQLKLTLIFIHADKGHRMKRGTNRRNHRVLPVVKNCCD